jgi:lipid-A-disaccharide synthase
VTISGLRMLVSCGEASGDLYAAALVRALRRHEPHLSVTGFGGPRLAAEGAALVGTYDGLSVTGLTEAVAVLRRSFEMIRRIEAAARRDKPDVFVAIDFPDFNFRLLPRMRRLGIPIVYYISPQLWAWRPKRMATIQRYVDQMLVIFPFERELYERAAVPVSFVGHPLIELHATDLPRDQFLPAQGLDPARPTVALLPGSRPNEIRHVLPTITQALPAIRAAVPGAQFILARAPGLSDELFDSLNRAGPVATMVSESDNVLAAADAAIVASGTATVQAALHDTPMVIVYRVSPMTYAIGRRLVGVSTFGMVNLVAGKPIVTELIQDALTPEALARETVALLTSRERASLMRADLADVRAKLGGGGATDRVAAAVLATARAGQRTIE